MGPAYLLARIPKQVFLIFWTTQATRLLDNHRRQLFESIQNGWFSDITTA